MTEFIPDASTELLEQAGCFPIQTMASSSRGVGQGIVMQMDAVPAPLREQLGADATEGLLQLFEASHREWRADVMAACTERFERRLVDEVAGFRKDILQMKGEIRQGRGQMGAGNFPSIAQMEAEICHEIVQMGASIRVETAQMGASIRVELAQMGSSIRQEIAECRIELLKWCLVFSIGQVVAIASIVGVMLRAIR